jgi:hypothetical protein
MLDESVQAHMKPLDRLRAHGSRGLLRFSAQGHKNAEISDLRPYSWPCAEKRSDRGGARPKRAIRPIASYGARTFISLSQ